MWLQIQQGDVNDTQFCRAAKVDILLTKGKVKMAGYWPSSHFAFLWTRQNFFRLILRTQKFDFYSGK